MKQEAKGQSEVERRGRHGWRDGEGREKRETFRAMKRARESEIGSKRGKV